MTQENYKDPENKARHDLINPALKKAGWEIQHFKNANIYAAKGVAVEFFQLGKGVGEADYVLFVGGKACGIIEAKKEGTTLIGKEPQSNRYASGFPKEYVFVDLPLPFRYESTGSETRFTNYWDPKPRSREVFNFHRPETLEEWIKEGKNTLRQGLSVKHEMLNKNLWEKQIKAVKNVEESLQGVKPRALVQMATGSGKTYTAVELCYRLIKNCGAKRILFLVDRGNLGRQTMQEFENYIAPKDGRKFTELYNVNRLQTNTMMDSDKVVISTIQRVYSILKGEKKFDPISEEKSGFEDEFNIEPVPVEYNPKLPIEFFDFIIVDECHRSIYNLWKQVLDYFDAFLIGLTATPSKSTIGFFNSNLVMEYPHEDAVADQVNVDFDVYPIYTKITRAGSKISKHETVQKRDMRTRRKRWNILDDDIVYESNELDRKVVAVDQIRKIIRQFKDDVRTKIFPGRKHVPKTLIYAKTDSHADDIVQIVREEFNEGNEFCQKITYKTEGIDPEDLISQFRNEFNPRIAVTVDMIATGTDIKPLEIVFFMRSVKSRNYFEQMKGRGVRVMKNDDFKAVTPDAMAKERFVIVDAIRICEIPELNETTPMDKKPLVPFEKLLKALRFGKPNKERVSSVASRLSRLQKKLTDDQTKEIKKMTEGKDLSDFASEFVDAIDEDKIYAQAQKEFGETGKYVEYEPKQKEIEEVTAKRIIEAIKPFIGNGKLMERLPEIKQETEQIIDDFSVDEVEEAGYSAVAKDRAKSIIKSFREFIEQNKDELTVIQAFYNKGKLSWNGLKELADKIKTPPYNLTPSKLWQAYHQLEDGKVHGRSVGKIADFVSILRFELGKASELETFNDTVDKRFAAWLSKQRALGVSFNQEQLKWLDAIKNHIAGSVEITTDDLELSPFDQMGGLGKAAKVFGKDFNRILEELTVELSA